MTRNITLYFLLFSLQGFSQTYINKSRAQVKKDLVAYAATIKESNPAVSDADSAIVLSIKGTDGSPVKFIYKFDTAGKCQSEKVVSLCETCYTSFLEKALLTSQYEWKKINGNQYISNFASRMLIEIPADKNDFTFIVLRTDWNKEMYDLLKGQ